MKAESLNKIVVLGPAINKMQERIKDCTPSSLLIFKASDTLTMLRLLPSSCVS